MNKLTFGGLLFVALFFLACKDNSSSHKNEINETTAPEGIKIFERIDAQQSGITFANTLAEDFVNNIATNNYLYNGGGVGIIDINNDGLPDVYFSSTMGSCKLYLNKGNLKFEDITESAGVGLSEGIKTGVTVADVNQDGYEDIYVCRTGSLVTEARRNVLFINNKNSTFSEQAKAYGLDDMSASNHANFFDYDRDGDLDMFLLNHPVDFKSVNSARASIINGKYVRDQTPRTPYDSDRFYKNNGNGTFTDVTEKAGVTSRAFGLSCTVSDFNNDGWLDIYVGNDYIEPDNLYINNKNGTFSDKMTDYFRHISNHTMGVDIADYNNDGWMDLVTLDMLAEKNCRQKQLMTTMVNDRYEMLSTRGYSHQIMRNNLQQNNGNGTFSEVGCMAGVYKTDWSWAPLFMDFDNDGRKDLYITNGYFRDVSDIDYLNFTSDSVNKAGGVTPKNFKNFNEFRDLIPTTRLSNYMFRNTSDYQFADYTKTWGCDFPSYSNGVAYADLDGDGDMELLVNNIADAAFLFKNNSIENKIGNYLQIKLKGSTKNVDTRGTRVKILTDSGQFQIAEMATVRGFFSSVQPLLHFGLGNANTVALEVCWADGKIQYLSKVAANQLLTLDYKNATLQKSSLANPTDKNTVIFEDKTKTAGVTNLEPIENIFSDFARERLLPHRFSNLGPAIAIGDVNGDGLDDAYLGAPFGKSGAVILQNKKGSFSVAPGEAFRQDTIFEDTDAIFFDADGDKDLDLFVLSGGNEFNMAADNYQPRLYLNDGQGKFSFAPYGTIPRMVESGGVAKAFDFDLDGDLDLVVGSRCVPSSYPATPRSFILKNEHGKFVDVTEQVAPEFQKLGMITGIAFGELQKDGKIQMVVVGEWLPISIFSVERGNFKLQPTKGLEKTNGWWNCVALEDVDKDGDLDIIAGNLGKNTRLTASADQPISCYAKDFDKNGALDAILTYRQGKKEYPLVMRDVLLKQIPSLKKKFIRNANYANATITDIYDAAELKTAQKLDAYVLLSGVFIQDKGAFEFRPFPDDAQVAPVKDLAVQDLNADGRPDLILVGNDYGTEVETGRYDASNGVVLLNEEIGRAHV